VAIHVYVGPTLPACEVTAVIPGARLHPPARNGDLLSERLNPGDQVLLIDGIHHEAGSVRQPEILDLLADGVIVVGAAGMGALRAAELHEFGMAGVGEICDLYLAKLLTGTDEIATAYGRGPDYVKVSEALVNIRHALRLARQIGFVGNRSVLALISHARALPYAGRTWTRIGHSVRRSEPSLLPVLALVRDYARTNAAAMDLMALDARRALGYVAAVPELSAPASSIRL